jgi:puromycin-sensitive aminopeptidase
LWKALAVTAQDAEAIRTMRNMANDYLRDRNSIDPDIVTFILEAAAATGDALLYDQIVKAYRSGGTPEENRTFLYVLADFRDPALLERTMAFALSNDVRNQDAGRLMAAVVRNPVGGKVGWAFLKQHWNEITQKLSDALQLTLVSSTEGLCDSVSREDVKSFFSEHRVPGSDRNLAQALEKISICSRTRNAQQTNLAAWLK